MPKVLFFFKQKTAYDILFVFPRNLHSDWLKTSSKSFPNMVTLVAFILNTFLLVFTIRNRKVTLVFIHSPLLLLVSWVSCFMQNLVTMLTTPSNLQEFKFYMVNIFDQHFLMKHNMFIPIFFVMRVRRNKIL